MHSSILESQAREWMGRNYEGSDVQKQIMAKRAAEQRQPKPVVKFGKKRAS